MRAPEGNRGDAPLRVAHFVRRYPPALGGAEAYFARLSRHLAAAGDQVTVFTTAALDLEAFWSPRGACLTPGVSREDGVEVRRYGLWRWPGRRYLLKALSLIQAADRVFVQTQGERQALLDLGIAAAKLVLLGMGVEPAECTGGDRERTRHTWGVRSGEVVIGHLANNSEEKGSIDLLRAAQIL